MIAKRWLSLSLLATSLWLAQTDEAIYAAGDQGEAQEQISTEGVIKQEDADDASDNSDDDEEGLIQGQDDHLSNPDFSRRSARYTTFPADWQREQVSDTGEIRLMEKDGRRAVQILPESKSYKLGYL